MTRIIDCPYSGRSWVVSPDGLLVDMGADVYRILHPSSSPASAMTAPSPHVIAGHVFTDGPTGRVCICGKRWADLLTAREDAIGQSGWAHVGALSRPEYDQIVAERDRAYGVLMG